MVKVLPLGKKMRRKNRLTVQDNFSKMSGKLIIQHGAEAIIFLDKNIIKERIEKSYRISEIDEKIRKIRTRSEAKLLEKAYKIISTPKVIHVNEKTKEIIMEFIDGKRLSKN